MISILVDPGYAFDYFAILLIKQKHHPALEKYIDHLQRSICSQIGHELWQTIISSEEFDHLLKANQTVFDSVELAKTNNITAKEVDQKNTSRFLAKIELQKKFFHNNHTQEWKT